MPRVNRRTSYEAPMNVDLPVDLAQAIDDFCDQTGMKKKQVVELSLRQFIAREAKPSTSRRGSV